MKNLLILIFPIALLVGCTGGTEQTQNQEEETEISRIDSAIQEMDEVAEEIDRKTEELKAALDSI